LLLAISGWLLADSLTKKSGAILTFKGLGSIVCTIMPAASCQKSAVYCINHLKIVSKFTRTIRYRTVYLKKDRDEWTCHNPEFKYFYSDFEFNRKPEQ